MGGMWGIGELFSYPATWCKQEDVWAREQRKVAMERILVSSLLGYTGGRISTRMEEKGEGGVDGLGVGLIAVQ